MKSRCIRSFAAYLGLAVLVFGQVVLSAHACPVIEKAIAATQADDQTPPCHRGNGKDDRGPVCETHCIDAQQNVGDLDPGSHAMVSSFAASFVATLDIAAPQATGFNLIPRFLLHATSPPLTVRNCCFRI